MFTHYFTQDPTDVMQCVLCYDARDAHPPHPDTIGPCGCIGLSCEHDESPEWTT